MDCTNRRKTLAPRRLMPNSVPLLAVKDSNGSYKDAQPQEQLEHLPNGHSTLVSDQEEVEPDLSPSTTPGLDIADASESRMSSCTSLSEDGRDNRLEYYDSRPSVHTDPASKENARPGEAPLSLQECLRRAREEQFKQTEDSNRNSLHHFSLPNMMNFMSNFPNSLTHSSVTGANFSTPPLPIKKEPSTSTEQPLDLSKSGASTFPQMPFNPMMMPFLQGFLSPQSLPANHLNSGVNTPPANRATLQQCAEGLNSECMNITRVMQKLFLRQSPSPPLHQVRHTRELVSNVRAQLQAIYQALGDYETSLKQLAVTQQLYPLMASPLHSNNNNSLPYQPPAKKVRKDPRCQDGPEKDWVDPSYQPKRTSDGQHVILSENYPNTTMTTSEYNEAIQRSSGSATRHLRILMKHFFPPETLAKSSLTGNGQYKEVLDENITWAIRDYVQSRYPQLKPAKINLCATDVCVQARRMLEKQSKQFLFRGTSDESSLQLGGLDNSLGKTPSPGDDDDSQMYNSSHDLSLDVNVNPSSLTIPYQPLDSPK